MTAWRRKPNLLLSLTLLLTLRGLKSLPVDRQDKLLLARLAVLYPQMRSSGGLHKGNLLLPDDPYGLALGYPIPSRKHFVEVAKKPVSAHSGSKRTAHSAAHLCGVNPSVETN